MLSEKFAAFSINDFIIEEEIFISKLGGVFKAKFKYDDKIYVLKERRLAELGKTKDMLNEVTVL